MQQHKIRKAQSLGHLLLALFALPTPFLTACRRSHRILLACLSLVLVGCASPLATQQAPELPARHWLDEVPGVPAEHKERLHSAVPNLYDHEKHFSFEDCVYLTIQQSPMLVNSAVDIEIKRLQLTDAVWQFLPEPHATVKISNNLTRYNHNEPDIPENYGRTDYEVGFEARFPNPLYTYFNHQAQQIMVNLAIATHRKAIGVIIRDIAEIYQRMEAQSQIIAIQKEVLPLGKKLISYWRQLEAVDGKQGVALNLALQHQREAELQLERMHIQSTMLRTKLKILAGINIDQKLSINTKDANTILHDFNGAALDWAQRWLVTEDELLLRAQVALQDFNIMVAWAEYVPDMTISVNSAPPSAQYQPSDGTDDTFVHLAFDFPLIDWGRRYRGVQSARMQKAKAFQEQGRARTKYSNTWTEAQQNVSLAQTTLKIAETNLQVAKMEAKEASINFAEGISLFPHLAAKQEALINARIAFVNAELDFKLAQLTWMDVAGILKERYIGKPAREVF